MQTRNGIHGERMCQALWQLAFTHTHTHLYRRVVGAHFTFAFVYFRATTGLNFHLHFSKYLLALLMTTVSVASSEICMLVH